MIRPATLSDVVAVARLDAEIFAEIAYPYYFLRQIFDAMGDLFVVAERDQQILGYAIGALQAGRADGWILTMAVSPDARRSGIATALLLELMRLISERGGKRALLHVDPKNDGAVSLYERHGFVVSHEEPDYFGPGRARMVMQAELRPRHNLTSCPA